MSLREGQRRLKRGEACPICGSGANPHRPNTLCWISTDGTVAFCGKAGGQGNPFKVTRAGGMYRLKDREPGTYYNPPAVPKRRRPPFAKLTALWRSAMGDGEIRYMAGHLGVSTESLKRLGVGWVTAEQLTKLKTKCTGAGAWTFPMRDAEGDVCGARLRTPSGFKYAVTGSDGDGILIPDRIKCGTTLFAAEGPTSTAALITAGLNAVGRPNNRLGIEPLRKYSLRIRAARIVIVGDNDLRFNETSKQWEWPGLEGARATEELLGDLPLPVETRMPRSHKDVRAWLNSSAMAAADIRDWFLNSNRTWRQPA
jgi:hypothetical protein